MHAAGTKIQVHIKDPLSTLNKIKRKLNVKEYGSTQMLHVSSIIISVIFVVDPKGRR